MSEPATIDERVTRLENEMAEVRYLAVKADREASGNTATLRGQVGLLDALRETQVEHSQTLAHHGKRLNRLEQKVDEGFAEMDRGFTEMRRGFAVLGQGQEAITNLLKARDAPDET